MNTKKGLSQVLVLIVAAAVLMMVGLMLVQLFSESSGDTTDTVKASACQRAVQNKCTSTNSGTPLNAPISCSADVASSVTGLEDDDGELEITDCSAYR